MKVILYLKESLHILFTALTYTILPLVVLTMLTARPDLIPGFSSFTVLTGSMEPLIPVGSMVYVFKSDSYKVGDIITFQTGQINVTHRIVNVVNKESQGVFYQTKGDANPTPDSELVNAKNVTGEILFHFPLIGKFTAFLRSVLGFLLLIVFPTLIFIGFELWNVKKEIEKETEKKLLRKLRQELHLFSQIQPT